MLQSTSRESLWSFGGYLHLGHRPLSTHNAMEALVGNTWRTQTSVTRCVNDVPGPGYATEPALARSPSVSRRTARSMITTYLVLTIAWLVEMLFSDVDGGRTAHVHTIHVMVKAKEARFETLSQ